MLKRMAIIVFALLFLHAGWTFASLYTPNAYDQDARKTLTASVWDSILNFFGLNNTQDTNSQESADDSGDTMSSEDFFGSGNNDSQYSSEALDTRDSYLDTSFGTFGTSNFACLPAVKHKGEPMIIMYKCPKLSYLSDSSFGADGDAGVLIRSDLQGRQYMDCTTVDTNRVQRFECEVQEVEPAILEFAIYPSMPVAGETVNLIAKSKDMRNCLLFNSAGNIKKQGLNFDFNYVAQSDSDEITLYCEDLSGLKIKRVISY